MRELKFKQHLSGKQVIASWIDGILVGIGELETVVHEGSVRRDYSLRFTNKAYVDTPSRAEMSLQVSPGWTAPLRVQPSRA